MNDDFLSSLQAPPRPEFTRALREQLLADAERAEARRTRWRPVFALAAAVLAHDAVEPALQPARQIEVCPVDREHQCIIQDTGVEPVWQDQF